MGKSDFREKSFWLSKGEYEPESSLTGHVDADVAIVGGGFTGLSSAYHLKKESPGLKIALLEGDVIGYGASGRNGGFNMTLFGLTLSITALRFGKNRAKEAHLYMERAVDTLKDLVRELKIDCDYEHPGFLRVATSEKYKKRLLHEIEFAHKMGLKGIEWLDENALKNEVRSPQYLGAWWEPRCGILNPAKLSWGWKDVLKKMGVDIYEDTKVIDISRQPVKVSLTTPKGTLTAGKVVLATNAWSHLIQPVKWKQIPAWTHIVLTEPLTQSQFDEIGWQNRQGIEDARNLVHYYRLTADNRLLMGGRDVSLSYGKDMDKDMNEATFRGLEDDVRSIFPSLRTIRFTHRWGGPVSITLDMAPALGYLGDNRMVYSVGCMGHGVSLTHLNGKTVSDLVLDKKTDLTDVFFVNRKTIPFPPEPLRNLASKAILGYMHFEDKLYDAKLPI
ncbi:MAG: FAD-binding oxidoreductase [Proteobacteria bacterium]|nr:FAD-binding oxidoreductase [Pseudomonadota bacterium]